MQIKEYDRLAAVAYARRWALGRNPDFYDFENYNLGGDCTNFVSQCLQAGGAVMNYAKYGWYYRNLNSRSPAWTGVEALFSFLTRNSGAGPYGSVIPLEQAQLGDIIQLSFDDHIFSHSLLITDIRSAKPIPEDVLIATHTFDCFDRRLDTYFYKKMRVMHIEDIREP